MLDEKGVRIDRSYISMLRNNRTKNPASDEINRALAEITGGDPDKLVYAAYIEKAPKELKEKLLLFQGGGWRKCVPNPSRLYKATGEKHT